MKQSAVAVSHFLDDHRFGNARFAQGLFAGMRGMGRLFQGAATVQTVLRPGMVEQAAAAGLRSLFVGFETLSADNLVSQGKRQNLGRDYGEAVRRLHDNGVMINARLSPAWTTMARTSSLVRWTGP